MTTVPLGEAKVRLSAYVAGVERTHDRVTITRHGRPAAVLVSADDLAALEETVDILAVPGAGRAISEGLQISSPAGSPAMTQSARVSPLGEPGEAGLSLIPAPLAKLPRPYGWPTEEPARRPARRPDQHRMSAGSTLSTSTTALRCTAELKRSWLP